MPHEQLWAEWLGSAQYLVPIQLVFGTSLNKPDSTYFRVPDPVTVGNETFEARFLHQNLYSVYVSTPDGFPGYWRHSVFYGRQVTCQKLEVIINFYFKHVWMCCDKMHKISKLYRTCYLHRQPGKYIQSYNGNSSWSHVYNFDIEQPVVCPFLFFVWWGW